MNIVINKIKVGGVNKHILLNQHHVCFEKTHIDHKPKFPHTY